MIRPILLVLLALIFPLIGRPQGTIEFSATLTATLPGQPPLHEVVNFILEGNNLRGSIANADPRLSNAYITFGVPSPSYPFQNPVNDGNWLYGGALWDHELLSLHKGEAFVSGVVVAGNPPMAYPTDMTFLAVPEPSTTLLCTLGLLLFSVRNKPRS